MYDTTTTSTTNKRGRVKPNVKGLHFADKERLFAEAVKQAGIGPGAGAYIEQTTGLGHGFVQRRLRILRATAAANGTSTVSSVTGTSVSVVSPARPTAKKAKKSAKKAKPIATPAPTAPAAITERETHLCVLLDASGSMEGLTDEVREIAGAQLAAINKTLADQDAAPPGGLRQSFTMTTLTFGDPEVTLRALAQSPRGKVIADFFPDYQAVGGTPLFDAIGRGIEELRKIPVARRPGVDTAYLVTIVTDGQENRSRCYSGQQLADLFKELEAKGNWTIAIQTPQSGKQTLIRLGIPAGNIQVWEATKSGAQHAAASMSMSMNSYITTRSKGMSSTQRYFADLGALTEQTVQQTLRDRTREFKRIHVSKEDSIANVINHAGYPFERGRTYYELTKDELIQKDKDMLVQKRLSKTIYGGTNEEVCALMGLPPGEKKIRIKNLGEWRVYVLSKSDNRVCVRGTDLLWRV